MLRFNYRLEPLLNVKRQMEDKAKNDLAKKIIKMKEEQDKLDEVCNKRERCIDRFEEESSSGVSVGRFRQYGNYLFYMNKQLQLQQKHLDNASQDVEIYREKLIESVKEKKMLETLKEKKLQQYMEDISSWEEKILEEVVSSKYISTKGKNP